MAIEIPFEWPNRAWVENTPLGQLVTIASDAASGTVPIRWQVSNWETTREMTSSSLPGQIRTQTGLSVGTGKCLVKRQPDDFPWKQSLVHELTGQDAQIMLAPEGYEAVPTGQFRVADVGGNLTTLGVQVDLDEKQIEGKDSTPGVLDYEWPDGISQNGIDSQVKDPIWWVAELAEQMGYSSGPTPVPGKGGYTPILDVPFHGGLVAAYPPNTDFETGFSYDWREVDGVVGLSTNGVVSIEYAVRQLIPQQFVITMDTNEGWSSVDWIDKESFLLGELGIEIHPDAAGTEFDLNIYSTGTNGNSNPSTSQSNLDQDRNWDVAPNRFQIEVTLTPSGETAYNSVSVRVRRRLDRPWLGPFVHAMPNTISRANLHNLNIVVSGPGSDLAFLANLSITDTSSVSQQVVDDLLSTIGGQQGRIYLEPLVGTNISPWLDPDLSVWSTMQAIVGAWLGAIITDVYGDLKVLNRFTLAGNNELGQERVLDVGLKFEDLPWTMNYNDQADRLVVKYRPVNTQTASPDATSLAYIYEFEDIIIAYPGGNEVFFTFDYLYPTDLRLLPFNRKDNDNGFYHVWDAYRYNNGTGAHIAPNEDIGIRIDRVTSSTWKVFIDNRTGSPFHMVDNTGTPWLKLRSSYWYDQTVEETVERGLPSGDSTNAMEVDLGHYVQTQEDANALADYLWGRVNARSWRANTVNMVPDYPVDLGDVVEVVHSGTGIRSNAIVAKVVLAGDPGSFTQKVDLILIPSTWDDFNEEWASASGVGGIATWADFNELWDEYTWRDFNRTPTATTVAQIEEGT